MHEIEAYILSNYPILYIVSAEEERFALFLEDFCMEKARRKLHVYSVSEGFWNIAFSESGQLFVERYREKIRRDLKDPIAVLEHIKTLPPDAGIFLLLDFNEFLPDPVVRRTLRDISKKLKASHSSVIILSPVLTLPPQLAHDVCVLDFPLPTQAEIRSGIENIFQTLRGRKVTVRLTPAEKERLVAAGQGLTMDEMENGLAKAVVTSGGHVDAGIIDEILKEKKQVIRKSGLLEFFETDETLQQVGGLEGLKTWLKKRNRAFSKKARDFGLPHPKGILLLGIQGCGKSLVAKAAASFFKFPLLKLDTGRLFSSEVGSSEANARRVIQIAEAVSPAILWIDEIEKAMAGVNSSSYSDAGVTARLFATIASWLQEKTRPVFVIATANTVANLPPELLRKGRFDEVFFLDLPGLSERESIFRIHLGKRHRNPEDFDIRILAENCEGYSGAEIEQAVIAGMYDAFDEERPLETGDILSNLRLQVPLSKTMAEQIETLRTWAQTRARLASNDRIDEQRRQWRTHEIRSV